MGPKAIVQIGYVGSLGGRLLSLLNINQPYLGGPTTSLTYQNAHYTGVTERPFISSYPQYGDINEIQSIGSSNYNSLQTVLKFSNYRPDRIYNRCGQLFAGHRAGRAVQCAIGSQNPFLVTRQLVSGAGNSTVAGATFHGCDRRNGSYET